jgi:glyoxylase-like metal-dependent hydrolase (beta-lactamase superfamily II)
LLENKKMVKLAAIILLSLIAIAAPAEAPPLEVDVLRTSPGSLHVNIALIKGQHKAVLVDVPFTLADAHRVAALVLDSGKELETVFVTHDHPDHFFAMEVITETFPDAKIVAHPTVVEDIWRSLPFKVKRWGPMLGDNGPRMPTAPATLEGDTIMLEGHELKVIGPMQGDHLHATMLWAPSIRALFAGDMLFNKMHLWLGEHDREAIVGWRTSLDRIAELGPKLIVPGHSKPGMPNDTSSLQFSKEYLDFWLQASLEAEDSAALRAAVEARFPDTIDALGDFILGNSSTVTMGEQPAWQE